LKELKGFSRVTLEPGKTKLVTIELPGSAFQYYDPVKQAWIIEPGKFEILIGASSGDIRLRKTIYQK